MKVCEHKHKFVKLFFKFTFSKMDPCMTKLCFTLFINLLGARSPVSSLSLGAPCIWEKGQEETWENLSFGSLPSPYEGNRRVARFDRNAKYV